jgi:hypothetical protein
MIDALRQIAQVTTLSATYAGSHAQPHQADTGD